MPPSPMFFLQASGAGIFMIVFCLEAGERFRHSRWLEPFIVLGQFTLSVYVGHILFGIGPLLVIAGWTDEPLFVSIFCGLVAYVVSLVLVWFWHLRFARGPLEMLMRRLARGFAGENRSLQWRS